MHAIRLAAVAVLLLWLLAGPLLAADLVTLTPENYKEFAPKGKEARAFFGDYVLRNDKITLAVADPKLMSGRSASRWSIANVSGALIDLARLDSEKGDMLRAYYPAPPRFKPDAPNFAPEFTNEADAGKLPGREPVHDKRIKLTVAAYELASGKMLDELAKLPPNVRGSPKPSVEVSYTLEDGWEYVLVEAVYTNPTDKPFTLDAGILTTTLRADDSRETGVDFDSKLFLISDTNWRFAYGVLADGHTLAPQKATSVGTKINHVPADKNDLTLAPGKSLRIARRLIPAQNEFQLKTIAAKILGIEFNAKMTKPLVAPPAASISVKVTDEKNEALACKIAFVGIDPTPTPDFFPVTGEQLVRNLAYAETGNFLQVFPPGKYRVTITAGPEFDAFTREIEVTQGKTTPIETTLKRVVDTAGYISADTHTHTAASGPQDQFFVYPYTPCAITDGTSLASPLGRVLNLLCENIEFAPTADHNFITTFEPYLKELHAEGKMATVPGIGLTAGRRHTVNHQNSFPVKWVEGAQDGGAIQRPEHVSQITWLSKWYDAAEKIIIVSQPCDSPLSITPEMDALDLQQLEPIIEGKPLEKADNRVLDWIAALNKGYRLPAVVSSDAYTNFHGAGGVRTYVQSSTDDPAKIDAMEVVRNLKRGRAVMTTGPFMRVSTVGPGIPGEKREYDPPIIQESLRALGNDVTLHVRVQSSNWAIIDRVQILVNGEHLLALNFTREKNAAMFTNAVLQFDQVIPVDLKGDSHLIVVASGRGPNLRAQDDGNKTVAHVAVSNPIFITTTKKAYAPASPLDDKIRADLEFSRPLLTRADGPPGHVRLTLKNTSDVPSEDEATLIPYPENAVKILGPATQKYAVPAGGETFVEWELAFTPEFLKQTFPVRSTYNNAGTFGVRVERSDKAPGRKAAARWMDVDNSIHLIPTVTTLEQVPAALKNEVPLFVRNPRNEQAVAEVRMAISGDNLALHAHINDQKLTRKDVIWEGSCVEIFGAMGIRDFSDANVYGGYRAINQLFLLPKIGSSPDTSMRQAKDKIVPDPLVKMITTPTDKGYDLSALIPLSDLGIDVDFISRNIYFGGQNVPAAVLGLEPSVGRFRMEVRVTSSANKAGDPQRGTMFRAGAPHVDHHDYGQFRLEAPVLAKVEPAAPLSFTPGNVGKVRMTLNNTSAQNAAGKAVLRIEPDDAAKINGESSRAFNLAPGKSESFEFELTPADTTRSSIDLVVTRSTDGMIITTPALTLPILDRPLLKLPAIAKAEDIPAALAKAKEFKILSGTVPIVSLRLAAAGDDLAMVADVIDTKVTQDATPWKGSCFELFAAGENKKITQLFLQPGAGETPARALLAGTDPLAPADGVRIRTTPTATGYQMQVLIPFATLHADATRPALEFQITATDDKGKPRRGTLFGSPRAYQDSQRYGRFLVTP